MQFLKKAEDACQKGELTEKNCATLLQLFHSYSNAITKAGLQMEEYESTFLFLLERIKEQQIHPYKFSPFHKKITAPHDYYQFSMNFTRPLVDLKHSILLHTSNIDKMVKQIEAKENVILLANHQTEVDPQLINTLLEKNYPTLAEEMIFVAGDRVLTDPLAVPFSMGCNLICIYSKRHIDNPPEKRAEKQQHNQTTMMRMKELFSEGGKCIYVAPSGGRDRPNKEGIVEVSPFDPQSIEMFRLMAQKAKRPAHFYPLALATYDILPPPNDILKELGEERKTSRTRILMSFGEEIDLDTLPGLEEVDRHEARVLRANYCHSIVKEHYNALKKL